MEVRNKEMKPYSDLSNEQRCAVVTAYAEGRLECYHGLDREWYNTNVTLIGAGGVYRTKQKEEGQQMKETQSCNENSFPWHMVDSKWNAVARDGNYPNWYLYKEKPIRDGEEIHWRPEFVSGCTSLSENAQKVIGVDMSQWNGVPWEESLMLRPGYREKQEERAFYESNCDDAISEEEADHLVNSVKEYPVVKMKELRNYKVGDVVRLKKTDELVVITVWNRSEDCDCCALYKVFWCYGKTKCSNFPGDVCFHKVKEE